MKVYMLMRRRYEYFDIAEETVAVFIDYELAKKEKGRLSDSEEPITEDDFGPIRGVEYVIVFWDVTESLPD